MDKRIKKTKKAIVNGVINLYLKKGKKGFSVRMLCEQIKINRSTFYLHYNSVEDVVDEMRKWYLLELDKIFSNKSLNIEQIIFSCAQLVKKQNNSKILSLLFADNDAEIFKLIKTYCEPNILEIPFMRYIKDIKYNEYIINFIIAGSMAIFKKWVNDGCQPHESELLAEFQKFFSMIIYNKL